MEGPVSSAPPPKLKRVVPLKKPTQQEWQEREGRRETIVLVTCIGIYLSLSFTLFEAVWMFGCARVGVRVRVGLLVLAARLAPVRVKSIGRFLTSHLRRDACLACDSAYTTAAVLTS